MSGRSFRRLAVTGMIITFGLLPLSTAHAAPGDDPAASVSRVVRVWGLNLLQAFQEAVGLQPESPESMAMDQDHDRGSDPQDGVGIDPHGRPRG